MGLDKNAYRYLKGLNIKPGVAVLTLGRQHNCDSSYPDVWAETILTKELKAWDVTSLDYSKAENPTFIKNLNLPVSEPFWDKFDVIIDGGTLEHVFNIPQALENIRLMLKPGGVFVSCQMCGIVGHGFYQLSPELFFRWANMNFYNSRCVAYRHKIFNKWHEIEWDGKSRIEIQEFGPFHFIFSCYKSYVSPIVEHKFPSQSGPSLTNRLKFWLWESKLWSRKLTK